VEVEGFQRDPRRRATFSISIFSEWVPVLVCSEGFLERTPVLYSFGVMYVGIHSAAQARSRACL